MEYNDFKYVMKSYESIQDNISELHEIGFNLIFGRYSISEQVDDIFNMMIELEYGEEGKELVYSHVSGHVMYPKFTSRKKLWIHLEKLKNGN